MACQATSLARALPPAAARRGSGPATGRGGSSSLGRCRQPFQRQSFITTSRPAALRGSSDPALDSVEQESFDSYDELEEEQKEELLSLTVSSPAILLNHMAERYTSTSRILMEFVDNGFDDAEAVFTRDDVEEAASALSMSSFVSGQYSRPLYIDVVVNKQLKEVRVVDNCRGMPREVLQRVVLAVGESRKRGMAFLNGQFGFGMQAFRAACEGLRVRSRHESSQKILEISVNRADSGGFKVLELDDADCPQLPGTGTEVSLMGFDDQWLDNGFDPEDIAAEIECHFERLLSRGNLRVRVLTENAQREVVDTYVCKPFDYVDPALGVFATVEKQYVWPEAPEGEGEDAAAASTKAAGAGKRGKGGSRDDKNRKTTMPQAFNVVLSVISKPMEDRYRARVFVNGRRIKEVHALSSFAAATDHRWDLWNHPQVVGYIDIAGGEGLGALQPVITRDEFKRTRMRKQCYDELIRQCEPDLLAALEGVQQAQSDSSMGQLESVLTACLAGVSREDYGSSKAKQKAKPKPPAPLEMAAQILGGGVLGDVLKTMGVEVPAPEPGTAPSAGSVELFEKAEREPKKKKENKGSSVVDFEVRMVRGLPDDGRGGGEGAGAGRRARSMLVGNTIMVDTEHPDFKARLKTTRGGQEKFDERLCGYLSTVISAHYRDRAYLQRGEVPESREQVYEDMIDTYVRLEERLRRNLPALLQQMSKAGDAGGDDASLRLLRRRARDR